MGDRLCTPSGSVRTIELATPGSSGRRHRRYRNADEGVALPLPTQANRVRVRRCVTAAAAERQCWHSGEIKEGSACRSASPQAGVLTRQQL
jgi:hypothetical protein